MVAQGGYLKGEGGSIDRGTGRERWGGGEWWQGEGRQGGGLQRVYTEI